MWLPRLQVLAAALLFSTGGMAIKSCGLSDWQIASFRCGVAALVMVALMPSARRWPTWRQWLVGVAYAATLVLYALANKATTAANAIFLQSTAPLYVFLLAPLLLGERSRRRDLGLMALMAVGLALLLGGPVETTEVAQAPARGNLYGALAGVSWAGTLLGLRWMGGDRAGGERGGGGVPAVIAGNVIAFVVCLPAALPLSGAAPADWGWILYLGVFQVAAPYMLLTTAMRRVPAFEASLLLLMEPVWNPVWAFLVHGETPGGLAFAGAALILVASLLKPWLDRRRGRPTAGTGRGHVARGAAP